MYNGSRFSQTERSDRTPAIVTLTALSIVALAISCVAHHDRKVKDSVASTTPTVGQPTVSPTSSGEVVDSAPTTPAVVTFASAEGLYKQRKYREAAASFDAYAKSHQQNAYGFYMLGLSAWKSGDLDRAPASSQFRSSDSLEAPPSLAPTRLPDRGRRDA